MEEQKHLVYLIHGTWARSARWCQKGSLIRKHISRALGEDTIFEPLDWSGRNSVGARAKAARSLRGKLIDLNASSRDRKVHIVAHSHAGNIVSYALDAFSEPRLHIKEEGETIRKVLHEENESIRDMIASVTFLSTPFLHIAPLKLEKKLGLSLLVILTLILTLIIFFSTQGFMLSSNLVVDLKIDSLLVKSVYFLLSIGIAFTALTLLNKVALRAANRLELSGELNYPTLIIRDSADEASLVLNVASFISNFAMFGIRASMKLFLYTLLKWKTSWRLYFFVLSLVLAGWGSFFDDILSQIGLFGLGVYAALQIGLPILLIIISTLLIIPLSLASLFFGGIRLFFMSLSMKISVEPTPPGDWEVIQLSSNRSSQLPFALNHSTHSNPIAIRKLRNWLEAKSFGTPITQENTVKLSATETPL